MKRWNRRVLLLATLALLPIGCKSVRPCEGDECECATDAECLIGCAPEAEMSGCDCTNGWPKSAAAGEGEEGCGQAACAAAMCADWTEYEARCSLGRCVGVPVSDHP